MKPSNSAGTTGPSMGQGCLLRYKHSFCHETECNTIIERQWWGSWLWWKDTWPSWIYVSIKTSSGWIQVWSQAKSGVITTEGYTYSLFDADSMTNNKVPCAIIEIDTFHPPFNHLVHLVVKSNTLVLCLNFPTSLLLGLACLRWRKWNVVVNKVQELVLVTGYDIHMNLS